MVMKKILFAICGFLLFSISYAYEPAITQVVSGQETLNCKEVVFITGEAITFSGTAEINISKKGESETEEYSYNLQDSAGNTLTREMSFIVNSEEKSNGQVTKVWELEDFQESIAVGGTTYTLEKYNFSKNRLDDVRAVGTYFAGNINLLKEYELKNEIKVIKQFYA